MLETKKDSTRDTYVRIRITEQEKDFIREAAAKENMTITDFIKTSINKYVEQNK